MDRNGRRRGRRPQRALQRPWTERILRIRLPVAIILCIPLVVGGAGVAWSAYVRYARYVTASGTQEPLTAETYQLFLHDEISRYKRRLQLPEPPQSGLPMFELSVGHDGMTILEKDARRKGKRRYADGFVRFDGRLHDVNIRHQGKRHWHSLGVQKSMKVRADRGDLINGVRVFNLVNDVTPFGLEEELIVDLARELGLLAPRYEPVRVRLNNHDIGVYRFEPQPDEGLLRRLSRMPGSMYSGEFIAKCKEKATDPKGPPCGWRKTSSRSEDQRENYSEIVRLLDAVRNRSHAAFRAYALEEIDLDKFALFDALDVVFGGDQHDYTSNHKLYYAPYRGRFEPVARDFRAFTHDPFVNLAESPLQLRLKSVPEYLALRDRYVYELLNGDASVSAIRARIDQRLRTLLPQLRADPYWDAYKLLPRASRFHRFMVRPMNAERWILAAQDELTTYSERSQFLLEHLGTPGIQVRRTNATSEGLAQTVRIEIQVRGFAAYEMRNVLIEGVEHPVTLRADVDLDGRSTAADLDLAKGAVGDALIVPAYRHLTSGIELVPDPRAKKGLGAMMTRRIPRTYQYLLVGRDAHNAKVSVELESIVTQSRLRVRAKEDVRFQELDGPSAPISQVPKLSEGEVSPHPWAFSQAALPQNITLGPDRVTFEKSRRFDKRTTVHVEPGTEIVLGPDVTLGFEGPVHFAGRPNAPVTIRAGDSGEPFGGLVIAGQQTAGSRLQYVKISGGSEGRMGSRYTPSLLTIIDTSDIELDTVSISNISSTHNVVHAAYVKGLTMTEVTISGAPEDAVDLEHSTAEIVGLLVLRAKDECLDTMTSDVRISDSLLLDCTNNAISAGERSEVALNNSVIARSNVGVLAKNASTVQVSRVVIYRADQALRTNRRDVHYNEASLLDADEIYAVACDDVVRRAKRTRLEVGRAYLTMPQVGRLPHIEEQVLQLDSWEQLDARLDVLGGAR